MDPGERWAFHKLEPWQFEQLAATVLEEKYNIQLLSFSGGKDGGRDAAARRSSIHLDQKSVLHGQNIVMQAKHTKKINGILDDGLRRLLFKSEFKKVNKMVQNKELDVYIVVLNYGIPAGQEEKVVKNFKDCGVAHVIVVGKETLIRWIKESKVLCKIIPNMYGIGGPGIRQLSLEMSSDVHKVKKDVKNILAHLDGFHRNCESQVCRNHDARNPTEDRSKLHNRCEIHKSSFVEEKGTNALLKTLTRSVYKVSEDMRELSCTAHATQISAMKRKMDSLDSGKVSSDVGIPVSTKRSRLRRNSKAQIALEKEVTDADVLNLSSHFGVVREWRFLARNLGLSELEISEIGSHCASPRDQASRALTMWNEKTFAAGARDKLIGALRTCHLNAQADEIAGKTKEITPTR